MKITLVMPAYNEAELIASSVRTVDEYLSTLDAAYELLVGDDGSTDGTPDIVRSLDLECVKVVTRPHAGKGAILAACFEEADGEHIGFLDSDLEIDVKYLGTLLSVIEKGADVAIASKTIDPALSKRRPVPRRIATYVYNAFVRALFRTRIRDHQAGLKVFRADLLRQHLPNIRSRGWLWDTEVLVTLLHHGAVVEEVPIETTQVSRPTRVSIVRTSFNMFRDLVTLYLEKRASGW